MIPITMEAKLSQTDIEALLKDVLSKQTGKVVKKVVFNINKGCDNQRDYEAPSVSVTVQFDPHKGIYDEIR